MNPHLARRSLQVLTGLLLGGAIAALLLTRGSPPADAFVERPFDAPAFALETLDGETFTEASLRGEVSVVFFGFTHCPDICPITLDRLSGALRALDEEGLTFRGIFVSVDPARDTPARLGSYMERFDPRLVALTGTADAIETMTEGWGIHVAFRTLAEGEDPHAGHGGHDDHGDHGDRGAPTRVPAGDYTVEHSTRSLVVDRRGRIVSSLAAFLTAEEIADQLRPLLSR